MSINCLQTSYFSADDWVTRRLEQVGTALRTAVHNYLLRVTEPGQEQTGSQTIGQNNSRRIFR